MSRIRTIKPEFPQSESMGRVSRDARLLFVELWTIADDSGRLRGNSRMLASLLFPYDDDAPNGIDSWLAELERERCVYRYAVEGQKYIQIINWREHQKIDKPSASHFPAPPEIREPSPNPRESSANPRERSSEDQGRDQGEDQGRDQGRDTPREENPNGDFEVTGVYEPEDKSSPLDTPSPPKRGPVPRRVYGSERNVLLTDDQYASLVADLGEPLTRQWIEELSTAKAMKGYKYKRDDLAIRKWASRAADGKRSEPAQGEIRESGVDPKMLELVRRHREELEAQNA